MSPILKALTDLKNYRISALEIGQNLSRPHLEKLKSMNQESVPTPSSVLNGLWLLLVKQDEEFGTKIENQVPVMAKAGNDMNYVLGFKNAANARKFLLTSKIDNAEPRMVVAANQQNFLHCAKINGAAGLLVDYDPESREYFKASELY